MYSPLVEYVTDHHIYSVDVTKEINTIDTYAYVSMNGQSKCKEIISLQKYFSHRESITAN